MISDPTSEGAGGGKDSPFTPPPAEILLHAKLKNGKTETVVVKFPSERLEDLIATECEGRFLEILTNKPLGHHKRWTPEAIDTIWTASMGSIAAFGLRFQTFLEKQQAKAIEMQEKLKELTAK